MNYADFAERNNLPIDLDKAPSQSVNLGYFAYRITDPGKIDTAIRIVSLSKDFFFGFMKLTDEVKAGMMLGLRKEAKASQEMGKIFTLENSESGTDRILVSLVSFTHEDVLHIEKR